MKKITYLFLFCALCFSVNIFAQETRKVTPTFKSKNISNPISLKKDHQEKKKVNKPQALVELTDANKKSLSETGFVRCYTVENEALRRQENPSLHSDQDFENWLAPLVQARKQKVLSQKANGTFKKAVVNVPIIFHVISGNPGDASDISDALVQAQIDQLNIDFGNQAGSTHPAATDAEIVFVPATVDPNGNALPTPGVNRVYGYPGNLTRNQYEATIKPNTIWDRSLYANVWTGSLDAGLLGYAQFPSNSTLPGFPANGGSAQTDGVVCAYGTIGSVNTPGSAAPYNLGRTLTHEVGHWIGLRHIWGDGGCNVDDFCADTPAAAASNGGCGGNTSCGSVDMIENYMDYSNDSCMDIFTFDQVNRIMTVLENADGISNLPNSNTADPVSAIPTISFPFAAGNAPEGTDCAFVDYAIPVNISNGASNNATVNFSISGTTGTNGTDFSLQTNSVTFSQGATAPQDVILRVFNDAFVEGDETVTINFTVNANGGDATAGIDSLTITIVDDDTTPSSVGATDIINEDFENGLGGFQAFDIDGDGFNWAPGTFNIAHIPTAVAYSQSWDNTANALTPDNYLLSPQVTIPANTTTASLSFDVSPSTLTNTWFEEYYTVYWAQDASTTATVQASPQVVPGGIISQAVVTETIDMTPYIGQTGTLVFRHHNCTDEEFITIDNVLLQAGSQASIQTAVNTNTTNASLPLPTSGSIYAADTASSDFILDITNNNTFDYGCLDVSVSRAGTGTQTYVSGGASVVADKTFTITPTNTTTTGNSTVDFYFTDAEISGWEAATGLSRNNLFAYREGSTDIVALTNTAFGSDAKFSGNFTGLAGTYFFGPESAFRTIVAPRVYLQGAAMNPNTGEETLMRDDLRVAGLIPTSSPYTDAITTTAAVFNVTGVNAIVDWVFVELRDATNSSIVIASQSALLQRDGDVVGVNGTSSLVFNAPSRAYYVTISHRNHMPIMSSAALSLTDGIGLTDFTNTVTTTGNNAQTDFNMPTGVLGMWAGNVNSDTQIRYQGSGNDTNSIKDIVLNDSGNGSGSNLYQFNGYNNGDVDLNGSIRYQGSGNDSNTVKDLILNHPENTSGSNLFSFNIQF